MRARNASILTLPAMLIAASALASMGGGPSTPPAPPPQESPSSQAQPSEAASSSRQQAERHYAEAYDEVAKAKKDAEDGKDKNAQKKFKQALEHAEEAVQLDEKYHEAWNLVGYASRKLGNYDKALKAYDRCLNLKPDYVPAREYLGEAYVELGDVKKAREQLVWLDHLNATEDARTLKSRIAAYEAAHPDSSGAHPDSAAAKPAAGSGM